MTGTLDLLEVFVNDLDLKSTEAMAALVEKEDREGLSQETSAILKSLYPVVSVETCELFGTLILKGFKYGRTPEQIADILQVVITSLILPPLLEAEKISPLDVDSTK